MPGPEEATVSHGTGLRRAAWDGLFLLLLPLAQLAIDPRWIFAEPGRDQWIYYGYFRFARIYLAEFADFYYSSRLSVILPGYLLRHLLPPVAANVVLHLLLFWLAAGCFYVAARAFAGRWAALLATLIVCSQPFFLLAIGWNYVDGFGIAYYLLALACLVLAVRAPRWRPWLMAAAGAAAVAIVVANLFYAIYLPLLAAHLLALDAWGPWGGDERRPVRLLFLRDLPCAAAGAVLLFGGLAAVGHFWGHGPLSFLGATTRFLGDFSSRPSIFKHPASAWLGRAPWLCFPVVVLGCSAAVLVRCWPAAPGSRRGKLVLFSQLQYVAFFLAMALIELLPQGVTFQYPYYASLLLPAAGLALAGQLSLLADGFPARAFAKLAAMTVLALAIADLAPLSIAHHGPWPPKALLPVAAGIGCVLIAASGRRGPRAALLFLVFLAASQLVLRGYLRAGERFKPHDGSIRRFFLQVDGTVSALREMAPALRLRLWYNQDEDRMKFYDTVASTLILCGHILTTSFPDTAGGRMCDGEPLGPGLTIAVLSQRPDAASLALGSLARAGFRAHLVRRTVIPGPAPPFAIVFLVTDR
jgi:hypothetical protein